MSCETLHGQVTDYLEGALAFADRRRFEKHLRDCDDCRAHLAHTEQTIAATRRLADQPLSETQRHNLLTLFRQWRDSANDAVASAVPERRFWSLATERRHWLPALRLALIATPILAVINHGRCLLFGAFDAGCAVSSVVAGIVPFLMALYFSVHMERRARLL